MTMRRWQSRAYAETRNDMSSDNAGSASLDSAAAAALAEFGDRLEQRGSTSASRSQASSQPDSSSSRCVGCRPRQSIVVCLNDVSTGLLEFRRKYSVDDLDYVIPNTVSVPSSIRGDAASHDELLAYMSVLKF